MSNLIAKLHVVDTWRELAFRVVDEIEWRELAFRVVDEIERLQAVADAARPAVKQYFTVWGNDDATVEMRALSDALRALDGEPRKHSADVPLGVTLEEP